MGKHVIFGFIVPAILVVVSVGAFISMRKTEPPKLQPLRSDITSRLTTVPPAEVRQVRSLSDFSETLDIQTSGTVVPYREIQIAAEFKSLPK